MDSVILGGEENFLCWKEKESLVDGTNRVRSKVGDFFPELKKKPSMQNQGFLVNICFRTQEKDVHKQWVAFFYLIFAYVGRFSGIMSCTTYS